MLLPGLLDFLELVVVLGPLLLELLLLLPLLLGFGLLLHGLSLLLLELGHFGLQFGVEGT